MGRAQLDSLAQRRLRQGALEERKPINGGHAGVAQGRQPRRRRPEQARQAIGDGLHRKHGLRPGGVRSAQAGWGRRDRRSGPRSARTWASACASPKPRLTPWPASGCTPCAASPTSASRCATVVGSRSSDSGKPADGRDRRPARRARAPPALGHARRASASGARARSSAASASGADQTIEMRRPGSGSHASTLPSARNHWRAMP